MGRVIGGLTRGSNWRHVEKEWVQQMFRRFAEEVGVAVQRGLLDDSGDLFLFLPFFIQSVAHPTDSVLA